MARLPVVIPENSSLLMLLLVFGSPSSTRRCGVRPNCPAITVPFRQRLLWLHGAGDAYTPIIGWRHYGDHRLAPLRRSCAGAYAPIINWLLYGDPWQLCFGG